MDIVIRGAPVADGPGAPIVRRDVGVAGGRIAAIGEPGSMAGKRTIDATGLVLAPGWRTVGPNV
jgi:N-acyl-D-amino-acid deacylase